MANKLDILRRAAKTRELSAIEKSVYEGVNAYRASQNLSKLSFDTVLSRYAKQHSREMARGDKPGGHVGFNDRVGEVAQVIPYKALAENVAHIGGYDNVTEQAIDRWIKSDSHRRAMEGEFDITGIGVDRGDGGDYFLTQLFVLL